MLQAAEEVQHAIVTISKLNEPLWLELTFFFNFLPFNVENPKGIGVFGIFEAFPSMREKPYIRLRPAESRQSLLLHDIQTRNGIENVD
jgi:hypothetical protein